MGDRLAHGEVALLDVELAGEEHRNEIGGRQRRGCRVHRFGELGEPRVVMDPKLAHAHWNTAERQAVRRQYQRVAASRVFMTCFPVNAASESRKRRR